MSGRQQDTDTAAVLARSALAVFVSAVVGYAVTSFVNLVVVVVCSPRS